MMRYLLLLAVAVAAHGQFGAATSVVSGNGAPVAAQCTNANNVGRVWARKDGGAASTTFYICAATGAGTYGWQLNDGAIGGAGNIASGQVLYGTGAGVAGTSSLFAFDGQRMRVGAAAGADGSALIGTSGALGGIWLNTSTGSPGVGNYVLLRDAGQNTVLNTETGSYIGFRINNVDFGRLFPSGNWGLGTTTDGNFRLDIASSGSSGTLRAYDQTPTTGVTQLVVRAGAGQSTTNLLSVNNNANTNLFRVKFAGTTEADFDITRAVSVGPLAIASGSSDVLLFAGAGVKLALSMMMGWSGDGNAASATQVAVVRNSSTAIEVNNGTAGTFRDLYLRGVRPVGSTVANLPTAAGNTGMLATVTDANATTIGTTVAGGGSDTVLVWSNGTNWRIYAN